MCVAEFRGGDAELHGAIGTVYIVNQYVTVRLDVLCESRERCGAWRAVHTISSTWGSERVSVVIALRHSSRVVENMLLCVDDLSLHGQKTLCIC